MKTRWMWVLLMTVGAAQAEEPLGCVEVTVGGYKAPNYDCLSQQMGNNPYCAAAAQRFSASTGAAPLCLTLPHSAFSTEIVGS